ncbi:MAG TPA: copper chaperone PCu(A)C [Gallionella sp.]|nr:copper chaperone PCu(A)C [Gallionella sp.]
MGKTGKLGGFVAAMLLSASVYAGDIQVDGAWARATAPGQDVGMMDLTITSKQAATLLGVSSPASNSVELHSMTHENGVMKMREVKSVELPAGKSVNLGESGYHLMLIGLKAPLKAGESVPLTLNVKQADKRTVKVDARFEVKPLAEAKAEPAQNEHAHHGHH